MKIKRTLFSIVVLLSVYVLFILIGGVIPSNKDRFIDTDAGTNGTDGSYKTSSVLSSAGDKPSANRQNEAAGSVSGFSSADAKEEYTKSRPTGISNTENVSALSSSGADNKPALSPIYKETADYAAALAQSLYSDIGISIANSYVNIREKANATSRIKGKLYKDCAAKILDKAGDWYYIESGGLKGYIKSKYLKTGIPDDELIDKYGTLRVSVNTDALNLRVSPEVDSEIVAVIYRNECYPAAVLTKKWVKIYIPHDNITGYVNREYVELIVDFREAISVEEEEELLKHQEKEKAEKKAEIKYQDEFEYTEDELKLLACLVHAEAGNQSYEGKLAVANVVLNRVKSGKFPDTIKDVIYQPGQFSVAKNGSLAKQLKKYDNYSSKSHLLTIKAAKAALSGENNIGNCLYFNEYNAAVKKGYHKNKNSVRIDDHLFW